MTRAEVRAPLNRSALIRLLCEKQLMQAGAFVDDVGPRLGEWLHFRQAIGLHSLLTQTPTPNAAPITWSHALSQVGQDLRQHVHRIRATLQQSILHGAAPGSGLSRIEMSQQEWDETRDLKTAFEPYRRFMSSHQRQMASVITTLRAQVRLKLKAAPHTQSLALLDAQFENILNEHEQQLLGKVVKLIEKRFNQAFKQHSKQMIAHETLPSPTDSRPQWLEDLREDLLAVLLAELDLRLEPTLGLLDAFYLKTE